MNITIHPSSLKGNINAPASKSLMQRACAAALLRRGKTIIKNPGHSNDDKAAISIIEKLGAVVESNLNKIIVESNGVNPASTEINCGESGLSIRMFTPIAALSNQEITINGTGSLAERPMHFFDSILPLLDVNIKSNNGKLPLTIQGPLVSKNIEVDGSLSSQFLTGLLFAFAASPQIQHGALELSIKVNNLKSKPYIDLTLDVMKKFGMCIPKNMNYQEFIFQIDPNCHSTTDAEMIYNVEGDWSGGAFLLVAGAIAGPLSVSGLDLTSAQADRAIVDALILANAGIAIEAKGIKLIPSSLSGFEFDATDCPDLFPPLVALAAYCKGATTIKGVSRLTHKESNRAATLKEEFGKMKVQIDWDDDIMQINGGEVRGAVVHSHHDHRIAMACAVAALKADGATTIESANAVNKSYPDFWKDLKSMGAAVKFPGYVL
ncbi:MAG: 3-phosphoshikimate 1-carboxyvinyltransferase [Chitinophagaceae bacterium]